ncbi:uncharacterized protein LOC117338505 [Pecten maximus]|uniref:uncharacterized protein LOC117338505 n=1 Tax=Pecten maximus TaxID=6579 RepID=UPI0014586C90|nr:uncharacterized protein LOC117338505 [Pecten maximus]
MDVRQNRKMTESGVNLYEEKVSHYTTKLLKIKRDIDFIIDSSENIDLAQGQQIIDDIQKLLARYEAKAKKFEQFLQGTRTDHSASEEAAHRLTSAALHDKVTSFIEHLQSLLPSISHKMLSTRRSGVSGSSRLTEMLVKHTAKVEKARSRMKYAQEEAELIKQEAALQASRNLLNLKRELEVAETGLNAIHKAFDFRSSNASNKDSASKRGSYIGSETNRHILRYVEENKDNNVSPPIVPTEDVTQDEPIETVVQIPSTGAADTTRVLNPSAVAFKPENKNEAFDLAKLVAKNQLLPQRLSQFTDEPARYLTWKYGFLNVMEEVGASILEHLDLLVNHLGAESKTQAENIRASNPRNSQKAVDEIWKRLDSEFGSAEIIERALKQRIYQFPDLKENDTKRFFDLSDLAAEVESIKTDTVLGPVFSYYDTSSGINDFVRKLPKRLREKWANQCYRYKETNRTSQVPFSVLTRYLRDLARLRNDPSFDFDVSFVKPNKVPSTQQKYKPLSQDSHHQTSISSRKTEVTPETNPKGGKCPIHGENSNHLLKDCFKFRNRTLKDRKDFVYKNGYCLKCCGQKRHTRKTCKETVKCNVCGSPDHIGILHPDADSGKQYKGEKSQDNYRSQRHQIPSEDHEEEKLRVETHCTEVCSTRHSTSKSCAKILLVSVFPNGQPSRARNVYCMIDDQSNKSLATSAFFDAFREFGPSAEYVLTSCAGKFTTSGRRASGYVIQSLDGSCTLQSPCLIECNEIPNNRSEIPSPEVAENYSHLRDIASLIPPVNDSVEIEILIGRDLVSAHHVVDQRIDGDWLPFGQKLPLGWVVIGDVCLGRAHLPEQVSVSKTSVFANGRPTYLQPCESELMVKEDPIFERVPGDEKPGLSIEDKRFLSTMDTGFKQTPSGHWEAPMPFKKNRPFLPDNKSMALKRANSFDRSLKSNPDKQKRVMEFMEKLFGNKHAELAPALPDSTEKWYLPLFAVQHPKKPDSIRVVFDSSAKCQNLSLNDVLLQGPDMLNSLLGILLRFRRERIAVTMDVEQMFYNFQVPEVQRRFLRFLWHKNNDLSEPLVEYQMTRHVFGNTASPAVANFGLRKAVENSDQDVQNLVGKDFYVDDGLLSCRTQSEAIDIVERTKHALQENGEIRLHKFASNSRDVLNAFCQKDLAKDLKDIDLLTETLPTQRSLGLLWDTETDSFTFKVNQVEKVYTRRGLLSTINSIYDPLGFAQPFTIRGKLLLREMMSVTSSNDWDDPLPESLYGQWCLWVNSMHNLENLSIPRVYCDISFDDALRREVLVFADASKDAIAAVAYLKLYDPSRFSIGFLLGKAKLAPTHGHTVPRLELCAAVLATEIAETIRVQLDIPQDSFQFFSDSQVVLGYISNESRRFYVYVGNRVSKIRLFSKPTQWNFVPSECNPADVATRGLDALLLPDSSWILGPDIKHRTSPDGYDLIDPDHDLEIRPEVNCLKMEQSEDMIDVPEKKVKQTDCGKVPEGFSKRFTRFSNWKRLVRVVARIKFLAAHIRKDRERLPDRFDEPEFLQESERAIIAVAQQDAFSSEFQRIHAGKEIPHSSSLKTLTPVIGTDGLLHVGGRLNKIDNEIIGSGLRNPVILPKSHHVTFLVVRHFHQKVVHQGRKFTEGAVRTGGYWVVSCRKMVNFIIHNCVTCKKLRGQFGQQYMADLPTDRCTPSPPFSYVGVDTFGPWPISFRRTRGGSATQKRWALLFTCLVTRAIHIEVIEQLSSSSFINALRRFISVRGPVIQFRSDRGTNFVGATEDLAIDARFVENDHVADFLSDGKIKWIFNPPYSPHMGGAWERLIGVAKNILNSMLLQQQRKSLTHERNSGGDGGMSIFTVYNCERSGKNTPRTFNRETWSS